MGRETDLEIEKKPGIVYIMRGVSGSGKSTVAREIVGTEGVIHSTDAYFTDENGLYKFDWGKLRENHDKNLRAFENSLKEGKKLIVVDNTNIRRSDYEQYAKLAGEYGYEVRFREMPHISSDIAERRGLHKVPKSTIEKQKWDFEESITG